MLEWNGLDLDWSFICWAYFGDWIFRVAKKEIEFYN